MSDLRDLYQQVRPNRQQGARMADQATIEREVVAALRTCYDPEIPVDIYELGLIYGVTVAPEGAVHVRMTLTSPNCPAAQELPADVEQKMRGARRYRRPRRDRLRSALGQLQDVRRREGPARPALMGPRKRVLTAGRCGGKQAAPARSVMSQEESQTYLMTTTRSGGDSCR